MRFAMPLALGTVLVGFTATAANAETRSCFWSGGEYVCSVDQTTAAGEADATTWYDPSSGYDSVSIQNNGTGYTMDGWVERRNNSTGVYEQVWGRVSLPNGYHGNTVVYNRTPYQVRACFQFTSWSNAAIHCTDWF